MKRPLVAVIGRRAPTVPILRYSATLAAEAICEAVWASGGEPAILHGSAADPCAELPARLSAFDAVLLPGGADIEPHRYGASPEPETVETDSFQDDYDLGVIKAVVDMHVPTLAICRGMQALNVAFGGTLVQHVAETSTPHHNARHAVQVISGSRLHAVVGQDCVEVSSYHHQAIDRLGRGLTVAATAPDGLIEAVEHGDANIVAVQWHPEDLHASSATDAALFTDLVERARDRRRFRWPAPVGCF